MNNSYLPNFKQYVNCVDEKKVKSFEMIESACRDNIGVICSGVNYCVLLVLKCVAA